MNRAIRRWLRRLRPGWGTLGGQQKGQSLVIITFAFVGILAFVGLAIDLGWVYVERVRVARAADAAALAGASELSLEGAAHRRALVYLQENGYDYTSGTVRLIIDGQPISEIDGEPFPNPSEEEADTIIWIDTRHARDEDEPNTADRIQVRVQQQVFMTFMQFIGFRRFPVEATAEAESINNLDVVIVYDKSGSMEYDTLCYGCWEPSDALYPSGLVYPLPWSESSFESADHCGPQQELPVPNGSITETYIIVEAEEYSRLSGNYAGFGHTPYSTFWVVQRNAYNAYHGRPVGAMGRDKRGAYLSHHPFVDYRVETLSGLGVACTWEDVSNGEMCRRGVPGGPFSAPRADYDFTVPRGGTYRIWIRGQGGNNDGNQHIFWGLDGSPIGEEGGFGTGGYYDGARYDRWRWRRLGSVTWSAGEIHTLNLWAGGAGFDVDRIIITTDPRGRDNDPPSPMDQNDGRGPKFWSNGHPNPDDWACNPCDPRFGGRPGGEIVCTEDDPPTCLYRPDCQAFANPDQRYNPIYDDEQPMRTALEAAKHFVARLEPRFDQIGYVRYSNEAEIASELQCLRRLPPHECTPEVITDTVLSQLDVTRAGGSTNIADGLRRGIQVLSTVAPHYGRPSAAHIMVLMTDGEANKYPDDECWQEDLWPDVGDTTLDRANDCVMYYAQEARDNGIVIYSISLGWSADSDLMDAVAELTGGFHRGAKSPAELDAIFDDLYERIFLRLIH
jgi:Flp pilus assembly protein TadG